MNTPDISHQVMDRVARFEKRRALLWIVRFLIILGISLLLTFGLTYLTVSDMREKQTFALFQLFTQDWEIISEYWQDTMSIILSEVSPGIVATIIFIIVAIIYFVVKSARIRHVMERRLQETVKYRTNKS